MDYLSKQQSDFLHRLSQCSYLYEALTPDETEICEFLESIGYIAIYYRKVTKTLDNDITVESKERHCVSITEYGKRYLRNEQISLDSIGTLKEQVIAIQSLAFTAHGESARAERGAKESKEYSQTALRISIFVALIQAGALALSIVSLVIASLR